MEMAIEPAVLTQKTNKFYWCLKTASSNEPLRLPNTLDLSLGLQ